MSVQNALQASKWVLAVQHRNLGSLHDFQIYLSSFSFRQTNLGQQQHLYRYYAPTSPGLPSRATFAGAQFAIHKLWVMSSLTCLIALISVTSAPNFLACSKMLRGACVCSCGTSTRSLSAIVSLPCCRRLRHEHNPVLISQAD